MDERWYFVHVTDSVEQSATSRAFVLDTVQWRLGQLIGKLNRFSGVSASFGELGVESGPQRYPHPPEAEDLMGATE